MKIVVCAPASLRLLSTLFDTELPEGYKFPMTALYAKALWEKGHDVTLVTNTFDVEAVTTWKTRGLKVIATPRRKRARAYCLDLYQQEVAAMEKCINAETPDIIHAFWTYEFAVAAMRTGIPTAVTAEDFPPGILWHYRDWYRLFRFLYSFPVVFRAKNLVTISPYLGDMFRKFYRRKIVASIPNGLEIPSQSIHSRAKSSSFKVTVVANWDRRKNIPLAIQAFRAAREEIPELTMDFFGGGLGEGGPAEGYAIGLGISEGLTFHGYQSIEDIQQFHLDSTDVLLHPSLEESFGMTVLEAMALAIPVIGGENSGAVPWVVGQGGCLVDITDPTAISGAIIGLYKESGNRLEAGQQARERAVSCFSMDSVCDQYLKLFDKVLSS